ncbi:MAG TPA: hypothetical protein VK886_05290 [Vicinamibacterales bacterium]|nr:hypothetical protein [Vicinamibacterales bacterium]
MAAAWIVVATPVSYVLGAAIGVPILVPVLNALAGYPFMIAPVSRGRIRQAIGLMLLWALCLGACATAMAWARPATTARLFINADAYEREMFAWIATGEGREGRPREFLPQHAAHAAVFSGLSIASGSALSMPTGAALMNYMGHYVGSLTARGRSSWLLLAGWHPWAVIRITSFVILGVVLAGPVLCAACGTRWRWKGEALGWLATAAGGLVADAVLKSAAAPLWNRLLSSLAGW